MEGAPRILQNTFMMTPSSARYGNTPSNCSCFLSLHELTLQYHHTLPLPEPAPREEKNKTTANLQTSAWSVLDIERGLQTPQVPTDPFRGLANRINPKQKRLEKIPTWQILATEVREADELGILIFAWSSASLSSGCGVPSAVFRPAPLCVLHVSHASRSYLGRIHL